MFKKWANENEENNMNNNEESPLEGKSKAPVLKQPGISPDKTNSILKGSKLIGDINVTCDLELSGEIQGNIISKTNSNIIIKGICKGNIETKEGSVNIEGELNGGNITAGNDVVISGKFRGGEIKAKRRIQINGEFDGKLEADEIEIGSGSHGKGELLYREYISIAKGAKIEAQIMQTQKELKLVKPAEDKKAKAVKPIIQDISEAR